MYCKHCDAQHLDRFCPITGRRIDVVEESTIEDPSSAFAATAAIAIVEALAAGIDPDGNLSGSDWDVPTGDGGSFGGAGASGDF